MILYLIFITDSFSVVQSNLYCFKTPRNPYISVFRGTIPRLVVLSYIQKQAEQGSQRQSFCNSFCLWEVPGLFNFLPQLPSVMGCYPEV